MTRDAGAGVGRIAVVTVAVAAPRAAEAPSIAACLFRLARQPRINSATARVLALR